MDTCELILLIMMSGCGWLGVLFNGALLGANLVKRPDVDGRHFLCQLAGFVVMICGVADVILQMLLSVNRFMVLLYPDAADRCFSPSLKCSAMIFGAVVCGLLCASGFAVWDDYGHFMSEHESRILPYNRELRLERKFLFSNNKFGVNR
uniref:Uncharacterized protein n=1 Tax=Romanomermis culicivorax TaxID=13658 RepID=A0A915HJQ7_ROMCU